MILLAFATGLAWAGSVALLPDAVPVHTKVALTFEYTVGATGLAAGDRVRIEEPIFHGIRWAKWGYLSTRRTDCTPLSEDGDVASAGLVRASAPGAALVVSHTVDGPGIHDYGAIDVELTAGALVSGDVITVELGVEDDDCGWQTADRAFQSVRFRSWEYLDGDADGVELPTVELRFVAEDEVASVRATLPSDALIGESVLLTVAPLDAWGNVAEGHVVQTEVVDFDRAGVQRVDVEYEGLSTVSNPIRVHAEEPDVRVYWGDLHTHHGDSWELDGEWIDENHEYARDVLAYDFGSESVKADPHELDSEDLWERVQRSCVTYTNPGAYVALLSFEWMGGQTEGHHNVYYDGCDGPQGLMDMPDVESGLWPFMEETMAATGQRMVSIPHAPAWTGYNWDVEDETLRPVAEVYSEWGNSMDPERDGSVPQGLAAGQRLGFIGSSDNHDGWLGNTLAVKNEYGGVAAIQAPDLSPGALLDSLLARRTYATTGERILLDVRVLQDGERYVPGQAFVAQKPVLEWSASGTAPISSVRLLAAGVGARDPEAQLAAWAPDALDASGSVELPWGPRELAVWLEVEQEDGELAWSSPLYLERDVPQGRGCGSVGLAPLLLIGLWRRRLSRC